MRGDGWVFLKAGKGRVPHWYVAYCDPDGKEHREPAKVHDARAPKGWRYAKSEEEALRVLRRTTKALDKGEIVTPEKRRLTVNEARPKTINNEFGGRRNESRCGGRRNESRW